MSEKVSFISLLTYGVRVMLWRPVHCLVYFAVCTAAFYGYFAWTMTESGQAFVAAYTGASAGLMVEDYGAFLGAVAVMALGSFLVWTIFYAGAYRIMVREKPVVWLPLQLGLDELRLIGQMFWLTAVVIAISLGLVVVVMVAGFVLVIMFAAAGQPMDADLAIGPAMLFGVILGLLYGVPLVYLVGRFSVSLPLTIKTRRFSLAGWRVSKGAGWPLFFAHVVIYLIMFAVQMGFTYEYMLLSFQVGAAPTQAAMEELAAMAANPYGDWLYLAAPLQIFFYFLMLGPTAAIAKAAAEEPVTPSP